LRPDPRKNRETGLYSNIETTSGIGRIDEKIALSRNNLMLSGTPYDLYLVQMTHILTYQSI
jgi:hypothetical protein